jgi:hypothetical protein
MKSARARIALALLLVLAAVGGAYAAGGKPNFTVSASPTTRTTTAGQSVTYTISIARLNGLDDPVALTASGLPAGATASFSPATVASNATASTLTVQTTGQTPAGTSTIVVSGNGKNLTNTTSVTLTVQAVNAPNFSIDVQPSSRQVVDGDQTTFATQINRTGGFTGAVTMGISGLPSGATSTYSPSGATSGSSATLTVVTNGVKDGTYPLTLSGSGVVNGSSVTRTATVSLVVQKPQPFQIRGNLASPLSPGASVPLDVTLVNNLSWPIKITRLDVSVLEGTSRPVCSGTDNFAVTPFSGTYPITLPQGTWQLSSLVSDAAKWPQVRMLNRAVSQDGCKGTTIQLSYDGAATK